MATAVTVVTGVLLASPVRATPADQGAPTSAHVNFQAQSKTAPPAGYTADYGLAYSASAGSGWEDSTGAPLSVVGSGVTRPATSGSTDPRFNSFVAMQTLPAADGTVVAAQYAVALANGTYAVTVTVGDPGRHNSVYQLNAQSGTANAITLVPRVQPTPASPFVTVTKDVTVSNGQLVLDGAGGTNVKIDYLDVVVETQVPHLVISAPADSTLQLPRSRVVFSTFAGGRAAPDQQVTFANTGAAPLTISNLAISGTNASDFVLPGAPGSITVAPGATQTVTVRFTPAAPTNCPTSAAPQSLGTVDRYASLTFTSNDPTAPTSEDLSGLNSCNAEGMYEPSLQQILNTLGYTDVLLPASLAGKHDLGPLRRIAGTDEVSSPYFTAADPSQPVVLTPLAHYSSRHYSPSEPTGYYLQGGSSPCASACTQLWNYPADTSSSYVQDQKLLPVPTGSTTFTPSGTFGLFDDGLYSDDAFNTATTTSGGALSPVHYIHDLRVYPAYGPGHVLIPNTYLIGIDSGLTPANKNNDFQDNVVLLRNATPAVPTAVSPGTAAASHNLTAPGGSVSGTCAVTGFDGVLPNTGGTQCVPSNIAFGSGGLSLTSTPGRLAAGDQQNALYDVFNATLDKFVVRARVVGPITQLTDNYQRIAAFFGPDQSNFITVEAEHTGSGTDPHLAMYSVDNGTGGTFTSVSVPDLTTASTLDLIITGNSDVPDPVAGTDDTNKVHGYPLDQLTVSYRINGGTPVVIGTVLSPANLARWFSTSAKAGIVVSNSGSTAPITATFSSFSVSTS